MNDFARPPVRRLWVRFAGAVAALLLSGCAEPDEGRLARLRAAEAAAYADRAAAEQALRTYQGAGVLEALEASYEAERRRIDAGEVSSDQLGVWKTTVDSLLAAISAVRTAPLDLEAATQDSVLVRLRSEYYAATDQWTFARLALSIVDDR